MSIRWNLIHELNCMEAVPDERTELAQLRKLKAGLRWTLPLLVVAVSIAAAGGAAGTPLNGLLWALLTFIHGVQDRRDLMDGSFLLAEETPSPAGGLRRMLLGGLCAGMALTGLFSTLLPALPGCLVLGGCGYWVFLALTQTAAMERLAQDDPEGVWPGERPGAALAALLGAALLGAGLLVLARPVPLWLRAEVPQELAAYTDLSLPDEPGLYRLVQSEHDVFELYTYCLPTPQGRDRLTLTVENAAVTAAALVREEGAVHTEFLWREGGWQPLNTGLSPTQRELTCLYAQPSLRLPRAGQSRILEYRRPAPQSPFGAQAARITWRDAQAIFGAPSVVLYELDAEGVPVAMRDESTGDNLGGWQLLARGEAAAGAFAEQYALPRLPVF